MRPSPTFKHVAPSPPLWWRLPLSWVLVLAGLFAPVGVLAQDVRLDELYNKLGGAKPAIGGRAGYAFGYWDVTAPGHKAGEVRGLVTMLEADVILTGGNGPLDYRFRWRMRGRELPEALGDTGTFADERFQTLRGHLRWRLDEGLYLRIGKLAVTEVSSITEVDPVQNLPCACFTGDLADAGAADLQWRSAGLLLGAALSGETPSAMSTDGKPVREQEQDAGGTPGGRGRSAPSSNASLSLFARLEGSRGALAAKLVGAGGQAHGFNRRSWGGSLQGTLTGKSGSLHADLEYNQSALAMQASQRITYQGLSLRWGGLRLGLGQGEARITATPTAITRRTNVSTHYRIKLGQAGWVGPELQWQNTRHGNGQGDADSPAETITSLRWLMYILF